MGSFTAPPPQRGGAFTHNLSEDDIKAITEYYAGKPFKMHELSVDTAMAAAGQKPSKKMREAP